MGPKKTSPKKKSALKKATTMTATAAAGQEFLKKAWGEDKLSRVNAMLEARDNEDEKVDEEPAASSSPTDESVETSPKSESSTKKTTKPKLSKARTMKNTATEGKSLIGTEVLGDTRSETKRRQAAVNAKKALEQVTKAQGKRKPALKRLGTMANTAREGKDFVKRSSAKSSKTKSTTGRSRTGGRSKKTN